MDINAVCSYLSTKLGHTVSSKSYQSISLWRDWYKGYHSSFHHYTDYNGKETVELDRYSLKMAKRVCEDWANLLLNEKVKISAGSKSADDFLNCVLNQNYFYTNANRLVEKAFALGTGAFALRLCGSKIKIDYITADCIIPISYDNGEIKEVCFVSEMCVKGKSYTYMELHLLNSEGNYVISNEYFDDYFNRTRLDNGIVESFDTNGSMPWFYIIKPNITNNINSSPMGISVFANSIDILKGIDLAYDNLCTDFYLGGKMVVMNESVIAKEQNGRRIAPQHSKKRLFMSIGDSIVDGKLFEEYNPKLRVDENTKGIKEQLSLLCANCGMGENYYNYGDYVTKTATEVISENSCLFRSVKKHELVLRQALTGLMSAILTIGRFESYNVNIEFDDSIIEDKKSQRDQDRQDVQLEIMTKEEYRQKYYDQSI